MPRHLPPWLRLCGGDLALDQLCRPCLLNMAPDGVPAAGFQGMRRHPQSRRLKFLGKKFSFWWDLLLSLCCPHVDGRASQRGGVMLLTEGPGWSVLLNGPILQSNRLPDIMQTRGGQLTRAHYLGVIIAYLLINYTSFSAHPTLQNLKI